MSDSPAEDHSSTDTNTMFSVALPQPQHFQHAHHHYAAIPRTPQPLQHHYAQRIAMPHREQTPAETKAWSPRYAADVAQALEVARDDHEGPLNPEITDLLDSALKILWRRVMEQPDSYVMTRDEFALFNYYQGRFVNNKVAIGVRGRYWDNLSA